MVYENELGGRAAIWALNLSAPREKISLPSVFNYKRKEQLRRIMEWLGKKPLPIFVEDEPDVFVVALACKRSGENLAAVFNLSCDEMDTLRLTVDASWKRGSIRQLQDDGEWKDVKNAHVRTNENKCHIRLNMTCTTMRPVILKFA